MSHFWYNFAIGITDVFKVVFQDSAIAQSMKYMPKAVLSDQLLNYTILQTIIVAELASSLATP